MPFTLTKITSPSPSSRFSVAHSTPMPAFRRTLSISSLEKPFASIRASTSKGLRRMSTLRTPKASTASSATTARPSASVESIPVFTIPDYSQAAGTGLPPSASVSPLTRPDLEHSMTMPAPVRAFRSSALAKFSGIKKVVCESRLRKSSTASSESTRRKSSVASIESVASAYTTSSISTTSTRRRSSSVSSVESFNSNEDQITVGLRLRAFPFAIMGLLTSIMAVIMISILSAMAPETPKRKPTSRPYEREVIITAEQERNPPTLRRSTRTSRLSRRLAKAYRRTLRRSARARRTNTPTEALAVLFAPTPKRVRASTPVHVDPKTLASEVPLVVYSSPIALPLPKGPAPAVRPARKLGKLPALLAVKQDEIMDGALCPGW
ncbi:hypothetical protein FB451DRAFT_1553477 [Mycena latifolia]|nr:hypothetical protein FB451DRAFT_1553477 [Mycena latifolia]